MIFPYQPHRFNERVVLVIHVYIQLQETGLFSLHKGFCIVFFFLHSLHNIRQYKIASCKNIRSLEDNKSVVPVHVFFHHSLNIYLHISYICTADRQAWLIHPQRGLFTEKCREILFFLMYFQLKCFSNGPLWHVTSRGRSSPGSDDARGASSTPSCITFRLITVTAGLLYDRLGCDEGQSVSSTVPSMSWRLLHSKLGGLALS